MENARKRTSMSVPEMGRLLGLGKTESYWLIKKNYFKTITVGGTMRVMIDSFEECCSTRKSIRINREDMPIEVVKSRFMKLDLSRHCIMHSRLLGLMAKLN